MQEKEKLNQDDIIKTNAEANSDDDRALSTETHGSNEEGHHDPQNDLNTDTNNDSKNKPHKSFNTKEDLTNFVKKRLAKETEKSKQENNALNEKLQEKETVIKELNDKIFKLTNKTVEKKATDIKAKNKPKVKDYIV